MTDLNSPVIRIGDIGFLLSSNPPEEYDFQRPFYNFFCDCSPLTKYTVQIDPVPVHPTGSLVFDSGQAWRLYQENMRQIIWVGEKHATPYLVGNFSPNYHDGVIYISHSRIHPHKYLFPLSYPLGEVLMTCLLGTGYGIMFHSCGILDQDEGILFVGNSSDGKTTTARLWHDQPGVQVLNDDHTIVRYMDGQYRLYGTPWHGEGGFSSDQSGELKKIIVLKKALHNHAEALPPSRAVAALLARSFPPLWDAPAMDFSLKFLGDLCQVIPCYEVGFVPNVSVVEFVKCLPSV